MRTRQIGGALALAALGWGCGAAPESAAPPLSHVVREGAFSEPALIEASGLVRSTLEPNVFWAQNDSGNDERVFAFDSTGRSLGAIRLADAKNRDWEAIAIGPCDMGSCLYVGDVGDNGARRDQVRIWRVAEPRVADSVSAPAQRLTVRYSEGPRDVEAMWIAPDSALFLLSKRPERRADGTDRPARLYRVEPAAWHRDGIAVAALVDSLPITPEARDSRGWITDAALSAPDSAGARRLAVRTYADVYVFGLDSSSWRPTALLARCSLTALKNATGEGLTWLPDGRLMFDAEGAQAVLFAARCP